MWKSNGVTMTCVSHSIFIVKPKSFFPKMLYSAELRGSPVVQSSDCIVYSHFFTMTVISRITRIYKGGGGWEAGGRLYLPI